MRIHKNNITRCLTKTPTKFKMSNVFGKTYKYLCIRNERTVHTYIFGNERNFRTLLYNSLYTGKRKDFPVLCSTKLIFTNIDVSPSFSFSRLIPIVFLSHIVSIIGIAKKISFTIIIKMKYVNYWETARVEPLLSRFIGFF